MSFERENNNCVPNEPQLQDQKVRIKSKIFTYTSMKLYLCNGVVEIIDQMLHFWREINNIRNMLLFIMALMDTFGWKDCVCYLDDSAFVLVSGSKTICLYSMQMMMIFCHCFNREHSGQFEGRFISDLLCVFFTVGTHRESETERDRQTDTHRQTHTHRQSTQDILIRLERSNCRGRRLNMEVFQLFPVSGLRQNMPHSG